jgi:hypothetical protein
VAYLALFVALGGTAAAAVVVSSNSQVAPNTISGHKPPAGKHANLISGSVATADIAKLAVTNKRLAPDSVGTGKVIDDSLTGSDVKEATLGKVPAAAEADHSTDSELLGGHSQFDFMQGEGNVFAGTKDVDENASAVIVLTAPAVAVVSADCNGTATGGNVKLTAGDRIDYVREINGGAATAGTIASTGFSIQAVGTSEDEVWFIHSPSRVATLRIAFLTPSADSNVPAGKCRAFAQATVSLAS